MKKILSVFLALAVILCSTSVVFASEDTTAAEISSAAEFADIANNLSGSYKLTADITLTTGLTETFTGIFDGNGHSITIGSKDAPATQGIFASAKNFTIKNLTVKGSIKAAGNTAAFVAAAPGNAAFINCINFADIISKTAGSYAGGFLGDGYTGGGSVVFENCRNYGTVDVAGNTKSSANGGLTGVAKTVTMTNSANYGNISAQSNGGGLIGWCTNSINISDCANFGAVANAVSGRENYVGGAVGKLGNTAAGTITKFFNAGTVTNGVLGTNSTYAGKNKITYCVNAVTSANAITGLSGVTTTGCYYLAGAVNDTTGAVLKTSDELKALTLEGYAKQNGYDYPLPEGVEYITKEDALIIKISTAEQFKNIANNLSGEYKLADDIDLSNCSYTAISSFKGVLDGNGYTINLGSNATHGIFSSVSNATIRNLTVKGSINATANAGAFADAATGTAAFINCTNFANVTAKSGAAYVGGILGNGYDGCSALTFTNCVNYGTVDVSGNTKSNSNGGIVGVSKNANIDNTVNYGDIIGQNKSGGIVGWSTNKLEASNCANFGSINVAVSGRENQAGGAVGVLGGSSTGYVKNFFNAGQVRGGVIGVYASSPAISYCINAGATTNVIAASGSVKTNNCYYLEYTGADSTGATSKTSAELKALVLAGFTKQDGYDYPLPEGIKYVSLEDAKRVIISTAEQFKKIADDLSGEYKLAGNIDLSNCGYVAISGFAGVLDGNGFTINLGNSVKQGIFATAGNFTIKNLTVKGAINATTKAGAFVGAATGTATFINCINYADVSSASGATYMGGILGNGYDNCTSVTFENCINYGTVYAWESTTNIDNGGLAGVTRNAIIKNCINYGTINGKRYSGGLIGWNTNKLELSDCANFGGVYSRSFGRARGGAVGNLGSASTGYIKNFLNAGQSTNGIAGSKDDTYTTALSISYCVNVATTDNAITNLKDKKTTDCYYLEGKSKYSDSTGATSKTSDELKELDITGFTVPTDIYGVEYPVPATLTLTTNNVTVTASEGGSVTPSGTVKVVYGRNVAFVLTADEGYYAEACSYNGATVALNNNSYTTPVVTAPAEFEVKFSKLSDIDVSGAVTVYSKTYTTVADDKEYYYGKNGSVITFAKAEKVGPLEVTECGLLVDVTNSINAEELVYDGEGVRILPFNLKNNSLNSDGSYGILIYNNSFTQAKSFKVRAYAKYSNEKITYSEPVEIGFDAISTL